MIGVGCFAGVFLQRSAFGGIWLSLICWVWIDLGIGSLFGLRAFGARDEPESLILAQSERWRHA